jgi:hypothetical protein
MLDATVLMSGSRYPTSSLILPLKHSLLERLKPDESSEELGVISAMKSLMHTKLVDR